MRNFRDKYDRQIGLGTHPGAVVTLVAYAAFEQPHLIIRPAEIPRLTDGSHLSD